MEAVRPFGSRFNKRKHKHVRPCRTFRGYHNVREHLNQTSEHRVAFRAFPISNACLDLDIHHHQTAAYKPSSGQDKMKPIRSHILSPFDVVMQ